MAAASDRVVTVFGGTGFLGRRIVRHLRLREMLEDANIKLDSVVADCPPSALVGQIRQIEEGSVSGSS
jgi:Mrp family chromosome partitioning ATPase